MASGSPRTSCATPTTWVTRCARQACVDVLAHAGNALAILYLLVVSRRAKRPPIGAAASAALARLAKARRLDLELLADWSVPDFGLAADGSMTLDYGPRSFRVGFDEHLRPFVREQDGDLMVQLPPPEAGDDLEKVADAEIAWRRLKRDVSALAALTIERLEEAMTARRAIAATDFTACFKEHRLVGHIARRVVWATTAGATFRIAEDGTLADEDDGLFTMPPDARVWVVHPAMIAADRIARWTERFTDYEILQPLPQLTRPVHRLDEADRGALELSRFAGRSLARAGVDGLSRRSGGASLHELGFRLDHTGLSRKLASGHHVARLALEPGLMSARLVDPTVTRVWFASDDGEGAVVPLGDVDPVDFSEAVLAVEAALAG